MSRRQGWAIVALLVVIAWIAFLAMRNAAEESEDLKREKLVECILDGGAYSMCKR